MNSWRSDVASLPRSVNQSLILCEAIDKLTLFVRFTLKMRTFIAFLGPEALLHFGCTSEYHDQARKRKQLGNDPSHISIHELST